MKAITQYITESEINRLNEGLLSKLTGWFKNLFKSQEKLEGKTIKTDVKNIKSPEKSTELKDIEANKEELKLIDDPKVGFPLTSTLIKQKNKYLVKELADDTKKEYKPLIDRYFYVEGNDKYDIGIIMYDNQLDNDDHYVNMLNIEVIDAVENKQEVLKFIHDNFENKFKKLEWKGAQYISMLPQIKGTLQKLGYKSQNNNQNILFKNFK